MACECLEYTCLPVAPQILQCGDGIVTLLTPETTGTWRLFYEFNGMWKGTEFEATQNEAIVLPNVFNEVATHKIRIYDGAGDLFNDTCYTLDMSTVARAGGGSGSQTVTSPLLVYSFVAGDYLSEFTVPEGYEVWLVAPGTDAYSRNQDFTQTGNTVTLINDAVIPINTSVTLFYRYRP